MPAFHVLPSPDPSLSWLIYLLLAFMAVVIFVGAAAGRAAPAEPPGREETALPPAPQARDKPASRAAKAPRRR